MRRIDHFAARLNPGLAAVAVILSTFLLGEVSLRYSAFFENQLVSSDLLAVSDPTASSAIRLQPPQ